MHHSSKYSLHCFIDSTVRTFACVYQMYTDNSKKTLFYEKDGVAVQGYVRQNFDEKCMVSDVLEAIIGFYRMRGGALYITLTHKSARR